MMHHGDVFDRVPDAVLLLILGKVGDVRSLGRCAAASRRFAALVPLVDDIVLKVDRVVASDGDSSPRGAGAIAPSGAMLLPKAGSVLAYVIRMLLVAVLKPFVQSSEAVSKTLLPQLSQHSPAEVLRGFRAVRRLRIELPAGDVGTADGIMLRWHAVFGSTLQCCVILGGTCMHPSPDSRRQDGGGVPEAFYTNGGLKSRVLWTVTSLISAATRHHLLLDIAADHPTLLTLELTDADGQGRLLMGENQLKELKENPPSETASTSRTQLPPSNIRLRYSPYLEIPGSSLVLHGATLVVIMPEGGDAAGDKDAGFVNGAFDGVFREAAKALLMLRPYYLEMNGF